MHPAITPVETHADVPSNTTVVVIGAGIIGIATALSLAEKGIPVVVLEKGRIGAEQSGRNLGWVRKLNRSAHDVPLALEAQKLWQAMAARTGRDVGYRQAGIMYVSRTDREQDGYVKWLESVKGLPMDTELLSPAKINELAPGGRTKWVGGIYSSSDGYAEPQLATSAITALAIKKGVIVVENCAARTLVQSAGHISGVATERGEIKCDQVLLAGGIWSRRFLHNIGIEFPTLTSLGSVIRTEAFKGPGNIATGASNFSFRKRIDGGYTIMQRGGMDFPITPDHFRLGLKYLPVLKKNWSTVNPSFGRHFFNELCTARRWKKTQASPFEHNRAQNPMVNQRLLKDAMDNLSEAWPCFKDVKIAQSWAGLIDITPDGEPVISKCDAVPGLTLACGFSGHGFGTAPAAAQLAADLIMNDAPLVDPSPYVFSRF